MTANVPGLAFGTREGYRGRCIPAEPIYFNSDILNAFVFHADLLAVSKAGFSETVIANWVNHMLTGSVPTMDQQGYSRRFETLDEFESHVEQAFNRLNRKKQNAILRNSKRK